ncbi:MAG: hypothetical protein ACRD6X_01245 [Pyrinomonadaceae bacterium]
MEKITRRVRLLPADKQEAVLEFVDSLGPPRRSILDIVKEIEETIPDHILDKLPTDGAENHDHYLYGAPKK